MTITFGSVCSGIEAASVAWNPLGWRAVWLAEIEPTPSKVLAHHYPDTPNLGNMLLIPALLRNGDIPAPDVFTGGTPCQAFSVAGLRNSLKDARGNLSLTFCEIADEIDIQRAANGLLPCVIKWENVPGVLSTKDNAFGCFLGALAGEDCALVAPGGKWSDAGCVFGPQRTVAWRILDAQFFGLAQRRRRVFVVASARAGFDPTAILFEPEGVRRNSPPSRSAGQDPAAGTLRSTDGGSDVDHARAGHVVPVAFGGNNQAGPIDVATARNACGSGSGRLDFETETFLVQSAPIAFSCKDHGADATTDLAPTMRAMGHSGSHANAGGQLAVVVHGTQDPCVSDIAFALGRNSGQENAVCIHADAVGRTGEAMTPSADAEGRIRLRNPGLGIIDDGTSYNLMASGKPHAVCITGDITHTLKAEGFDASEDGTGRGQPIVAQMREALYHKGITQGDNNASAQEANTGAVLRVLLQEVGEKAFAQWGFGILNSLQQEEVLRPGLYGAVIRPATFSRRWVVCCALGSPLDRAEGAMQSLREAGCEGRSPQGSQSLEQLAGQLGAYLSGLSQPGAQAARLVRDMWNAAEGPGILREALSAVQEVGRPVDGEAKPAYAGQAVRRLTPVECARLMGFADDYLSQVRVKGKPLADGPMYKALGNSWAIPCVFWIGKRIDAQLRGAK